jgi:hypothetical protein
LAKTDPGTQSKSLVLLHASFTSGNKAAEARLTPFWMLVE